MNRDIIDRQLNRPGLAFGVASADILPIWDWVSGRHSLWSPAGLPIALKIGWERYEKLLSGAASIDAHPEQRVFTSQVERLRGQYMFTPRMFVRAVVQNERTRFNRVDFPDDPRRESAARDHGALDARVGAHRERDAWVGGPGSREAAPGQPIHFS